MRLITFLLIFSFVFVPSTFSKLAYARDDLFRDREDNRNIPVYAVNWQPAQRILKDPAVHEPELFLSNPPFNPGETLSPASSDSEENSFMDKLIGSLIEGLKSQSPFVNQAAAWSLVKIGKLAANHLINALNSSDASLTISIKEILVKIGKPAVVPLINSLESGDKIFRRAAAEVFGEIGDPRAAEALVWIMETDKFSAPAAQEALIKIGKPAVELLVEAFKKESSSILIESDGMVFVQSNSLSIEALIAIGEAAVQPLSEVLADNSQYYWKRMEAAEALGKIGGPAALQALVKAFKDKEWPVRQMAARSVIRINDFGKFDLLNEALDQTLRNNDKSASIAAAWALYMADGSSRALGILINYLGDLDADIQKEAGFALEEIGVPAVKPLIDALRAHDLYSFPIIVRALTGIGAPAAESLKEALATDEDAFVRIGAAEASGNIRYPGFIEDLGGATGDANPDVRATVVIALGRTRDPVVIEYLIKAMGDEDSIVRERAAWGLGEIGDIRGFGILIKALGDVDPYVRKQAARSLGRIRDPAAVKPLIDALGDVDPGVRTELAVALGIMRASEAAHPLIFF